MKCSATALFVISRMQNVGAPGRRRTEAPAIAHHLLDVFKSREDELGGVGGLSMASTAPAQPQLATAAERVATASLCAQVHYKTRSLFRRPLSNMKCGATTTFVFSRMQKSANSCWPRAPKVRRLRHKRKIAPEALSPQTQVTELKLAKGTFLHSSQ